MHVASILDVTETFARGQSAQSANSAGSGESCRRQPDSQHRIQIPAIDSRLASIPNATLRTHDTGRAIDA
jgi:hypothetical protein